MQKIFLNTTRLLATRTDNVVDELWNYIKQGKLAPDAIFLLAAQRQYRNLNGFDIIKARIEDSMFSLESGKNAKEKKAAQWDESTSYEGIGACLDNSQSREALEAYVQTQSEVSHLQQIN
jgi:hypothetical protein